MRCEAYMKSDSKSKALWDGVKCVELAPGWSKGYNRLGTAQHALGRYDEAIDSFKKGKYIQSDSMTWITLKEVCMSVYGWVSDNDCGRD